MKSEERKNELGEVFTPPELVNEVLDKILPESWKSPNKTWLDPTCGNGAFLIGVMNRLLEYHTREHILDNMIYGVDLMRDNIEECIISLYGEGTITVLTGEKLPYRAGLIAMFKHDDKLVNHIVQADGLLYDYKFDSYNHIDAFLS